MYNPDTELLFPARVIPTLRDERGKSWSNLVDKAADKEIDDPDQMAFVLMMIRLNGCTTCHADSFRAMRGCTACSSQNVRRFRGPEKELNQMYKKAHGDVDTHLKKLEKKKNKAK
ncbi:MAG: hypothetical protein DWQ07_04925 [Chloroflexi bacterium]|nr:MAG: hypothetical protein DWQ07_04925 [Chloroflexota bacterium]MBL1194775.1 hypothetical protein [Chloroflexota bacterium]NOH12067.1 hypothetical protein [Chloroflexota bacterium]